MDKRIYDISITRLGSKEISWEDSKEKLSISLPSLFKMDDAVLSAELMKSLMTLPNNDKKIRLEHEFVLDSHIPVISLIPENDGKMKMPLLFLLHGFETSKEKILKYGLRFASAGFFTVMMDAPMHGQRFSYNLFHELYDLPGNSKEAWKNRLKLISAYLDEIIMLIDYYSKDPRIDIGKIGISGISMGATVAILAASRDPRIRSAAAFIPVLDYENMVEFDKMDLSVDDFAQARKLDPVYTVKETPPAALFILGGSEDNVVGASGSRKLDKILSELYSHNPARYLFREYAKVGHTVTLEMADDAIEWFQLTLEKF